MYWRLLSMSRFPHGLHSTENAILPNTPLQTKRPSKWTALRLKTAGGREIRGTRDSTAADLCTGSLSERGARDRQRRSDLEEWPIERPQSGAYQPSGRQ